MKVGDLVQHPGSVAHTGMCAAGIIVKVLDWKRWQGTEDEGVMVMWDHGEVCYAPIDELEAISESR
jgi:hypothetical protein